MKETKINELVCPIKLPEGTFCGLNCADGCFYWNPNERDSSGRQYCCHYGIYYYPREREGCPYYKENLYRPSLNPNLGLWEFGNENYYNLYVHNDELYYTNIFFCPKSEFHPYKQGTYVSIGKYKIDWKWENVAGGYWNPAILKYIIDKSNTQSISWNYSPCLSGIGCFIKKSTIYGIIEYAKQIEQLSAPTYISTFDRDTELEEFTYSDRCLYILNCVTDHWLDIRHPKRVSMEEFLEFDTKTYGDEMLKKCYLNPFKFEEEYPELVEEAKPKKKWFHFK